MTTSWSFETKQIHAGQVVDPTTRSRALPISFVDNPDDPDSWRAAVRPNTKAFFGESIANPKNDIFDIEALASVAHGVGTAWSMAVIWARPWQR
jgi:O-acetylhomoserine/O-acetylserine sulfhydrylase-like pyridoxal-dependent enzyme